IAVSPIDVALVGIGEEGRLALTIPPADFSTETPYLVIRLDEFYRRQRAGEDGFTHFADVPERAISISIQQLLKAKAIVCVVPDAGKSEIVRRFLEGPVSPLAPASILHTHPDTTLYLDQHSAALLSSKPRLEHA